MAGASATGANLKRRSAARTISSVIYRHVTPASVIWVIILTLLAATWLALIYQLKVEERSAKLSAQRQVSNYARLLEEHTLRTMRMLDQATLFIKSEFERGRGEIDL